MSDSYLPEEKQVFLSFKSTRKITSLWMSGCVCLPNEIFFALISSGWQIIILQIMLGQLPHLLCINVRCSLSYFLLWRKVGGILICGLAVKGDRDEISVAFISSGPDLWNSLVTAERIPVGR